MTGEIGLEGCFNGGVPSCFSMSPERISELK